MRNRYVIQAQTQVATDVYSDLLAGKGASFVFDEVKAAMNKTAAERRRRVFGEPRQIDAVEDAGLVTLTFEAYTEPAA